MNSVHFRSHHHSYTHSHSWSVVSSETRCENKNNWKLSETHVHIADDIHYYYYLLWIIRYDLFIPLFPKRKTHTISKIIEKTFQCRWFAKNENYCGNRCDGRKRGADRKRLRRFSLHILFHLNCFICLLSEIVSR